jgi:hypothetical protein
MIRPFILFLFLSPLFISAQTTLKITNVQITEKEQVMTGSDVTASLNNDEGKKGIVIYAGGDLEIKGSFKVKSHNVARSSVKNSAVYLSMNLKLKTGGKTDSREVMKTFYMDDTRSTEFKEKFVIKRGIDTRVIEVRFDAAIE